MLPLEDLLLVQEDVAPFLMGGGGGPSAVRQSGPMSVPPVSVQEIQETGLPSSQS